MTRGRAGAGRRGGGALHVVFGDQLDLEHPSLRALDAARGETILMMEVAEEATHVPSHRQRTVLFLSAMRHFAASARAAGHRVRYVELDDPANTGSFDGEVRRAVRELNPARLEFIHPGEQRVMRMIERWRDELGVPVVVHPDTHFLTTIEEFGAWARGRKELVMEYFYRDQRRRLNVLMEPDGTPTGGAWNFDKDNRLSFPRGGPSPRPPKPKAFAPDAVMRGVMACVNRVFPSAYGSIDEFIWPVTRAQALDALADFIEHRLALFGPFEDAMWTTERFVYHSLLSPALNLKLLNPRECIAAAVGALKRRGSKAPPLQSVEAFVRQIIGWREFIRGVYWHEGPGYEARNALGQRGELPGFYWTGETDMNCLRQCLSQVVELGYGHHIQRLMVTGNFAMIAGVHPKRVSDWYLGMYVDGVDWVTLPNTLGMSQHADGGVVGTKPYAASANYIGKMSNYCAGCRYDAKKRTGEGACPFNTFYWDFLIRHRERFARNHRMTMILKQVEKMPREEIVALTSSAAALRKRFGIEPSRTSEKANA